MGDGLGDAPNDGTLGGTLSDGFGENSSTMGGEASAAQAAENASLSDTGGFGFGVTDGLNSMFSSLTDPSMFYDMPDTSIQSQATPVQNELGLDNGILGKLKGFFAQMAMSKAQNALGITPLSKAAFGLATSKNNNDAFNSIFGLGKGMAMGANPAAAVAMGLADMAGLPNNGMTGNAAPGATAGLGANDVMGGLLSLYGYNKSSHALDNQINSLQSLFSPNSPYAQQLRQQLERKDAASGRRSQYGPRETQLMALLADKAASQTMNLNQLQNQRNQMRGQGLGQLWNLGQKMGLPQMAANGLGSLFNDGYSGQFNANMGPALDPYGAGSGWGQDTLPEMGL